MPHIFILIFAIIVFFFPSLDVFGQNAQQKTQDLIAALGKTKHKKKEKKGFYFESYVNTESEAVVKNNIREYAGVYESSDSGSSRLELRVSADGKVEGSGFDISFNNFSGGDFTLKNASIEGALLTATKVYSDGRTRNFEAVFNNRTTIVGTNPNQITERETKYGIGFVEYGELSGSTFTSRMFLEFKR
jgi:hypothetical protein